MNETGEIEKLLEARIAALARKDGAAANALPDPNIVAFELAGELQVPSAQARDDAVAQAWLDTFEEGPKITIEELNILQDGNVAFSHSLNRLQGKRSDGKTIDLQMRSTIGFRKLQGKWTIVHAHTSLPL